LLKILKANFLLSGDHAPADSRKLKSSIWELDMPAMEPQEPIKIEPTTKVEEKKPAETQTKQEPATTTPLTRKEERELRRKQKKEQKEKEKNQNNN
jgi:penicillin-binding protein 1A